MFPCVKQISNLLMLICFLLFPLHLTQSQISSTTTHTAQEMVVLLSYANQWLAKYHAKQSNKSVEEASELQELEHKVWQWKLKAEVEKVNVFKLEPTKQM